MRPGAIVSIIFGSIGKVVLIGVLLIGAVVGGGLAVGVFGVPDLVAVDNTFGETTEERTVIETDLVVSNPNPIGVDLADVSVNYTVSMNDVEMAHGEREGVAVPSGNGTVALETAMRNERIPAWWPTHVANDERTTIGVDATVTSDLLGQSADVGMTHDIETDLIGAFDSDEPRPVNADSPAVNDPVLYVNETRGEWGQVSDAETPIEMAFVVYNPNLEPYVITQLGYEITMNDVKVGEGETQEEYVIPSRSTETVELTTAIDNRNLDEWWVSHLDEDVHGHQVSELRIEFSAVIELPTGERVSVPLDELTYEETIETDIFDEGLDRDRSSDDDRPSDGETDDGTNGDSTGDDGEGTDGGDGEDDESSDGTEGDGTEDGGTETPDDDDEEGTPDDGDDDDDGGLPL